MNGYGVEDPEYIPPGWDEWYATTATTDQWLYDYTLNENGELVEYGSEPEDFKQDVLTERAIEVIERTTVSEAPLFLTVNYTAPHVARPGPEPPDDCSGGAKPAPRHASSFDDEPLPMPPSFNEDDVSDKPREIRDVPMLSTGQIDQLTARYRCYLEALLSIDEGVDRIADTLRTRGELDQTLLIFTSDNGFLHGEHRTPYPKSYVYEGSIRVPLLMRGPGVPAGEVARTAAINADLAPTIIDVAGAKPGLEMDGESLLPAAKTPSRKSDRALLLDTHNASGVRTARYVHAEYDTGERELYDLRWDPDELDSVDDDPAYAQIRSTMAELLDRLRRCAGRECRVSTGL